MGIKICPKCGGKVSETRDNCIHCGYVFLNTKKCPDCGEDVDASVAECPECGHIFEEKAIKTNETKSDKSTLSVDDGGMKKVDITENDKEKHNENEHSVSNVTCSSCGSSDCTQLDEYTYKCNHCFSVIKIKKPDVKVFNINSFAGDSKTEDVPIYQVVKNLDEETFVRKCILHLAHSGNVSPTFLENFRLDKSMVSLAYLTFISKDFIVDITYTCEIGKNVTVKYYLSDGSERRKTETQWEPFAGKASDGGTTTFCAFGSETKIEALIPLFYESSYEFEPFKESDRYPLKRRADRSVEENEKEHQIRNLEHECERNLPGDYSRNFKSNGRCILSGTKALYYVPTFSLIAESNGHKVVFSSVANEDGKVRHVFLEGTEVANSGDETMPKEDKARGIFRKTSFGIISLISVILLPLLIIASIVLAIIFSSFYYVIGVPIYLAGVITTVIFRRRTIDQILDNLVYEFKQRKLLSCKICLEANNLAPLSKDEERYLA